MRVDWARWRWNLLVALDQLANAITFGDPDETISSRAAKAQKQKHRWGCVLCKLLDYIDPGHCEKSLEADEGGKSAMRE